MQTATDWTASRLAYLHGLKAPSEHQRLLLVLADKEDRTADEERKLAALWRAEKAADRAQRAKANAARIVNADREAERKARTHRLIELGGLIELADVGSWDKGILLGALLGLAQVNDPERKARWKASGDARLADRERSNG